MVFMQDNAPCHKSRKVMDFMEENNIETMEWPPQSPDMNPIENLWAIIKIRRQKKFGVPNTKQDLIEQIFEIWDEIDINLLQNLSESFLRRIEMVKTNLGRQTKY